MPQHKKNSALLALALLLPLTAWAQGHAEHGAQNSHAAHTMPAATAIPTAIPTATPAASHQHAGHAEAMQHSEHMAQQGHDAAAAPVPSSVAPAMDHSAHSSGSASNAESGHAEADHSSMQMQGGTAPADARDPHAYSNGLQRGSGIYALPGQPPLALHDGLPFSSLRVDRLEAGEGDALGLEGQWQRGTALRKALLKFASEAEGGEVHEASAELLGSWAIAPYWDAQLGLRTEYQRSGKNRSWLALGVQGLAPYWFELGATAYLGAGGRSALQLEAEYELLLSQRWVLQPKAELRFYGGSDSANLRGSGLSSGSLGLRLRYEVSRQLAPYIGVERSRSYGNTASLLRGAGEKTAQTQWVAGLRFWF